MLVGILQVTAWKWRCSHGHAAEKVTAGNSINLEYLILLFETNSTWAATVLRGSGGVACVCACVCVCVCVCAVRVRRPC